MSLCKALQTVMGNNNNTYLCLVKFVLGKLGSVMFQNVSLVFPSCQTSPSLDFLN